jgi:hypothetical protein
MKLWEARKEAFTKAWDKGGVDCRVCERRVEVHRRSISPTMARCLFELRIMGGRSRYIDVKALAKRLRPLMKGITSNPVSDFSKLGFWGLIVERAERDDSKRASGLWMLTKKGERAILGEPLPRYCWELFSEPQEFSEEMRTIERACGDEWDYHKLVRTPCDDDADEDAA